MEETIRPPSVDIPIGQASDVFGVTLRALRFYEEVGLLRPGRRGPMNIRVYDAAARRRVAWIAGLRRAGLRIPEIRLVLEAEDRDGRGAECALELLKGRRRRLIAALRELRDARAWLMRNPPTGPLGEAARTSSDREP